MAEDRMMTNGFDAILDRFGEVFARAATCGFREPNQFNLATVDRDGRPSSRMLLLKGYDRRGFTFYTNLHSRKAEALAANALGAMCFYWEPIYEQVRIEGRVHPVAVEEADEYFESRSRESQIGAWASAQSQALASREDLMSRVEAVRAQYEGQVVPRPPHWSGFRLQPDRIEFWSGSDARLHDRDLYTLVDGSWMLGKLYP